MSISNQVNQILLFFYLCTYNLMITFWKRSGPSLCVLFAALTEPPHIVWRNKISPVFPLFDYPIWNLSICLFIMFNRRRHHRQRRCIAAELSGFSVSIIIRFSTFQLNASICLLNVKYQCKFRIVPNIEWLILFCLFFFCGFFFILFLLRTRTHTHTYTYHSI